MKLDLLSTIKGSALEDFFPAGWEVPSRSVSRAREDRYTLTGSR